MTTHLSPDARAWHARFEDALKARDTAAYLAFLHPESTVQINNALPLYAKAAIKQSHDEYLQAFRSVTIDVLNLFGDDQHIGVEALFTYSLPNGATEVVQCAYFLDRNDEGLITSVRVYGNGTRVFKAFMRPKK